MIKHCNRCGTETERGSRGRCKPCARAGAAARYAVNPEKRKASNAAWTKANLEKVKAINAAWYAANLEKARARGAAWRAANPEKVKAKDAAWRAANPGKVRAQATAWRAANPEKVKAASAAYKAANPEKQRVHDQNRRARKRQAGGKLSPDIEAKLLKLQKGKCACCRQKLGDDYHLDHILPLALGGTNTNENMQLLRAGCNQQKYAKHPVEFMQQRGFLL